MDKLIKNKNELIKIGKISHIEMGQSPRGDSYNSEKIGIPLINGPTEFTNRFPIKKQWTSKPTKICNKGDILLCVRGSSTGRINIADDNYCIGRGVAAIRGKNGFLTSFIEHILVYSTQRILKFTSGSTFPNIDKKSLSNFEVTKVSIEEQKKISQILSAWDKAIDQTNHLIEAKQKFKKGLMQQLLTGKKQFPYQKEKRLEDCIEKIIGGGTPSRKFTKYWEGRIPWATVKDLNRFDYSDTEEHINLEGLNNSSANLIPKGTVIVSTRMAVGKAVIFNCDVAINQDLKGIFPKANLDKLYLLYWFNTHANKLERIGSGSTVKGITLETLKKQVLFLPTIDDQKFVASVLNAIDLEIKILTRKLELLNYQKKGLMQKLLTGKVRVKI